MKNKIIIVLLLLAPAFAFAQTSKPVLQKQVEHLQDSLNRRADTNWVDSNFVATIKDTTAAGLHFLYGLNRNGNPITNAIQDFNTIYSAANGVNLVGTQFGVVRTTSGTGSFVTDITQTTNGYQVSYGTPSAYSLPTASASVLGGIKVGSRLSITSGVLSADNMIQSLSLSGNTLSISGGNSVTLPAETDPIYTADKPTIVEYKGANPGTDAYAAESGTYYMSSYSGSNNPDPSNVGAMAMFKANNRFIALYARQATTDRPKIAWGNGTNVSAWKSLAFLDDIPATPTLQQVSTAGNTSTNSIFINRGTTTSISSSLSILQNGGGITFSNGTSNSNIAIPRIDFTSSNSPNYGAIFQTKGNDGGWAYGTYVLRAANAAGTGAVTGGKLFALHNYTTEKFSVDYTGAVKSAALAGTGERMVTVLSDGTLSTQALPTHNGFVKVNSNYTIADSVGTVLMYGNTSYTLTLPDPSTNRGRTIQIAVWTSGTITVFIGAFPIKYYNDGTTVMSMTAVNPGEHMRITSDGTDWWRTGY